MLQTGMRGLLWAIAQSGVVAVALAIGLADGAIGQIVPDDTLGAERSRVTAAGDRIEGGAQRGQNLFHSFREFNVGTGQQVYFANPADVRNIFSRVTGTNVSNIDGVLGVDGGANLFLMNPNGIVFGQNARLDVGGSFVGTTANAIGFGDRGWFSATSPEVSSLLTIEPSAFLFNQIPTGKITNTSTAPTGLTTPLGSPVLGLQVPDGQSLLLVGGDISINRGRLNALGGRIELGGLAGVGTVDLNIVGNVFRLNFPANSLLANLILANDARISARGIGGGDIVVNTNLFDATAGGRLVTGTEGAGNGGDITVNSREFNISGIGLSDLESGIYNQVLSKAFANSGNVVINTKSFNASFGAGVFVSVQPGAIGNAGNILVNSNEFNISGVDSDGIGAGLYSQVQSNSIGNSGQITVNTETFRASSDAGILSSLRSGARGDAGNIIISANSLYFTSGAELSASTFGQGNAGDIFVHARNNIYLNGMNGHRTAPTAIFSTMQGTSGRSGKIRVSARSLSLTNGAQLVTRTFGRGDAGNVFVHVSHSISLSGRVAGYNPDTSAPQMYSSGILSDNVQGQGNAGRIDIEASSITLRNDALILSSVSAGGRGNAGNIHIRAQSLNLISAGAIATSLAPGDASIAGGRGRGGNIRITSDSVHISGESRRGYSSGIFSNTRAGAFGRGGDINIHTGDFHIANGGVITTQTQNSSNAGDITINANSFEALSGGELVANTFEQGRAGNITLHASTVNLSGSDLAFRRRIEDIRRLHQQNPQENDRVSDVIANVNAASGLFASTEHNSTGRGGNINITARQLNIHRWF